MFHDQVTSYPDDSKKVDCPVLAGQTGIEEPATTVISAGAALFWAITKVLNCLAESTPSQPWAITPILTVPKNPGFQSTVPFATFIVPAVTTGLPSAGKDSISHVIDAKPVESE